MADLEFESDLVQHMDQELKFTAEQHSWRRSELQSQATVNAESVTVLREQLLTQQEAA